MSHLAVILVVENANEGQRKSCEVRLPGHVLWTGSGSPIRFGLNPMAGHQVDGLEEGKQARLPMTADRKAVVALLVAEPMSKHADDDK